MAPRTISSASASSAAAAAPGASDGGAAPAPVCFAVINPDDLLLGLGGFVGARRAIAGAAHGQLALVAVDTDDSHSTLFEGVKDDSLINAADEVVQRMWGRKLESLTDHVDIKARDAAHGFLTARKLQAGAAALVRVDRVYSHIGAGLPGDLYHSTTNAPGRLQGVVDTLHDDGSIDVRLSGHSRTMGDIEDRPEGPDACRLVREIESENAFVANVKSPRVAAYIQHQPVISGTFLKTLRYSLALIWPEPVRLEDIQLRSCTGGGEALTDRQLGVRMTLRDILEGDVDVFVKGQRVPVLDPSYAVTPTNEMLKGSIVVRLSS